MSSRFSSYYRLAKPGIVYGNTIALIAGFFFYWVTGGGFNILNLLLAVVGTALVMASACVANNIIDTDIDIYMKRTANRALVTGDISKRQALYYSAILLIVGGLLLWVINLPSLYLAISGWLLYVFPYTYLKRVSYHATLVGALPGAVPPLVGYYAAGGTSVFVAIVLFSVLVAWQMVHFYAIAIFREPEYAAANVPIITVTKGVPTTVTHMQIWTFLSALALLASIVMTNNWVYAIFTLALIGWWLRSTVYEPADDTQWSRKVFLSSLLFLLLWLGATALTGLISLL